MRYRLPNAAVVVVCSASLTLLTCNPSDGPTAPDDPAVMGSDLRITVYKSPSDRRLARIDAQGHQSTTYFGPKLGNGAPIRVDEAITEEGDGKPESRAHIYFDRRGRPTRVALDNGVTARFSWHDDTSFEMTLDGFDEKVNHSYYLAAPLSRSSGFPFSVSSASDSSDAARCRLGRVIEDACLFVDVIVGAEIYCYQFGAGAGWCLGALAAARLSCHFGDPGPPGFPNVGDVVCDLLDNEGDDGTTTTTRSTTTTPSTTVPTTSTTIPAPVAPTLRIDGETSSSRPQRQTFHFSGTDCTPGRTVTRRIVFPDGHEETLRPTLSADARGDLAWTYTSVCTTPIGSYSLWAIDDATGRKSNVVTEHVTRAASCTPSPSTSTTSTTTVPTPVAPTLRIDGGTSSTRPQLGTFSFSGSGYTPGRTVTRRIRFPDGHHETLSPHISANGAGHLSWAYTSVCTTPLGTYTLWAIDDATGRQSNVVTESLTTAPSCP